MDEDEMIYREMNEEDPWYMGDNDASNLETTDGQPANYSPGLHQQPADASPMDWVGLAVLVVLAIVLIAVLIF